MEIKTDFLVIGSGIAGLSVAIKAAALGTVAVVTKKETVESNTNYAQGGVAAVVDPQDTFESHVRDTIVAGAGLCREDVVQFVVQEGPERIQELIEWGVAFTKSEQTEGEFYDLGKEGGHSRRRVLHATDFTGREIERALHEKAGALDPIRIYENYIAIDLIMKSKILGQRRPLSDRCIGAYVYDIQTQQVHAFRAKFVILATGGAGKVYTVTTNPDVATGDGIAIAYRAGASIANMEFMQFHPTCLYHPEVKSFLISEAVRGEGAILRLKSGDPFMERYHPLKDLAPRDIVARAIDNELKKTGDEHVYLDITHRHRNFIITRFPNIYGKCLDLGIDITVDPIPVVPAAHYLCGGVAVDHYGRTSIDGLFACGEVSCTGFHGANRLASNSLLEGAVFAHRTYSVLKEVYRMTGENDLAIPAWDARGATESDESIVVSHNWDEIRRCMSNYVGIVRSNKRLERAKRRIELICREIDEYYRDFIITRDLLELRNIATVAKLIIQCARLRKESRGLHYNMDYPDRDDRNSIRDTVVDRFSEDN
ncbi:MAG: L-aspartate oxidase [Syntrophus sp. SKADARSKE-3]|nr:L-aspartate oxidase [Syntrophus sp. SKADARSKE-3]